MSLEKSVHASLNRLCTHKGLCTGPGPGLARSPYPARQIRSDFSNGPGRQMRGEFSHGPGQAGKWKVNFPTGRTGPANNRWFFQRALPAKEKWVLKRPGRTTKKARRKILHVKSTAYYYYLNAFPNLHPVCSFHNSDLLILFAIDFDCL